MSRRGRALPSSGRSAQILTVILLSLGLVVSGGLTAPASAAAHSNSHPTLKVGSKNSQVLWVQKKLGVKPQTSYFGPITKAAVTTFQRRVGLRASGVVDSPTWTKLGVRKTAAAARPAPSTAAFGAQVLGIAKQYKGKPYARGGNGPTYYDCSGFVKAVFARLGHKLPRTSAAMRAATPRVAANKVVPGDLVFVHNGGGGRVSHVAIYAGGGKWWEATRPGKLLNLNKAWTRNVSYGRVR